MAKNNSNILKNIIIIITVCAIVQAVVKANSQSNG